MSRSTRRSRPKKSPASAAPNARSPLYGFSIPVSSSNGVPVTPSASVSACPNAATSAYRRAGSAAVARSSTARTPVRSAPRTCSYSPPMPVSAAAATTARLYRSDAGDRASPASCSGEAYGAVGDDSYPSAPTAHTEVRQVGVAVAVDQDVLRLHVAVDDAVAMGRPQRAGDLGEHRRGAIGRQRPAGEHVGEAAGVDQAHHQVRGTGLAPVVVQRDDVRVLEPGDELGLGLEPADERRIVGELGLDHLDRHLTPDDRLVGPEHRAERASSDLLAQLVAPHRQARPWTKRPDVGVPLDEQAAVVDEDLMFEVAHRPRRLDPDLGDETLAERGAGAQRLGGAAAPVQRQHQRHHEAFAQRVLADETLQLGDELAGQPEPEIGVDPVLDRLQSQLLEPGDLRLGPRLVGELLVGVTAPHRQPGPQRQGRARRIGLGQDPSLGHRPLEPADIGVVTLDRQHVARRAGQQDRALRPLRSPRLECRPQARDVHPQRVVLVGPARLTPQLVEDPIRRQHRPGVGQQQREQRPLTERAQLDRTRRPARPPGGRALGSQRPCSFAPVRNPTPPASPPERSISERT